jgi:hypothetical protein
VDVDTAIRTRRTHKQYGSEPVSEAVVRELVGVARWAPNHKLTNPWRFRLLGTETRRRIDELVPEAEVMKLRRAHARARDGGAVRRPVLAEGRAGDRGRDVRAPAATDRGLASTWRTPSLPRASIRLLGLAEAR